MSKNIFTRLIIKVSKKLVHKLYYAGVFDIVSGKKNSYDKSKVFIGDNCYIEPTALFITVNGGEIHLEGNNAIGRNVEIQPLNEKRINIGYGTSIQDRNIILGDVEIGKFCLTAPNVYMSSGKHYFDLDPYIYIKDQDKKVRESGQLSAQHSKKIMIDDDVWIGINSVIMRGVKIGKGSVIGSNSVVTKDVEPYSIMVGSPARLIKKRIEFIPQKRLHYMSDQDMPYFYKGAYLDQENLVKDRERGGVAVDSGFILYLSNDGNKINIILKNITGAKLILDYQGEKNSISDKDYQIVTVELRDNGNYHQFNCVVDDNFKGNKYLLIKEVEVIK